MQLTEAIRDLENSSYQFSQVMKEVGSLNERTESDIYLSVTGNTWRNYLKSGGSRTMINGQLPKELDFNGVGQLD